LFIFLYFYSTLAPNCARISSRKESRCSPAQGFSRFAFRANAAFATGSCKASTWRNSNERKGVKRRLCIYKWLNICLKIYIYTFIKNQTGLAVHTCICISISGEPGKDMQKFKWKRKVVKRKMCTYKCLNICLDIYLHIHKFATTPRLQRGRAKQAPDEIREKSEQG